MKIQVCLTIITTKLFYKPKNKKNDSNDQKNSLDESINNSNEKKIVGK